MNSTELIAQAYRRYGELDIRRKDMFPDGLWTNGYIQGWMDNPQTEKQAEYRRGVEAMRDAAGQEGSLMTQVTLDRVANRLLSKSEEVNRG